MSIFMEKQEKEELQSKFSTTQHVEYQDEENLEIEVEKPQIKDTAEKLHGIGAGEIHFFSEKPIIKVKKVESIKKNMFTSMRVFTIEVNNGDIAVKRSREDLKWLVRHLKEEFPNTSIAPIHQGELNRAKIEKFFDDLIERIAIDKSRYLMYFLTANDEKFYSRRERDMNWVTNLKEKFKDTGKVKKQLQQHIEPLKPEDITELKEEDEVAIEVFLDEVQEEERNNLSHYTSIIKLSSEIAKQFDSLSKNIFKLGNELGKVSCNLSELEKKGDNWIDVSNLSECYNMFKMSLYIWSGEISKIPDILTTHVKDYFSSESKTSTELKDMFKLRKSIDQEITEEVMPKGRLPNVAE